MKKVIGLILILAMVLSATPALAFEDSIAYGMTFRQEGNKAVIMGLARNTSWLTIPPVIGGLEVDIDPGAFRGNNGIISVTFDYGWKKIPDGACREMSALTKLTIPASVEEIGAYAFSGTAISEINITNAKTIGEGAFSYCENLTKVRIPKSVTAIGDMAFAGCERLGEIHLEDTKTIGARAFENCTALHTINHNGKVISIGEDCFNGCPDITEEKADALLAGYKVDTYSMTIPPYNETATQPMGTYFVEFTVGSPNYKYEVRNYASGETYAYIKNYYNMNYYHVPESIDGYPVLYGGCFYRDGFYYYSDSGRLPHATLAGIATGIFSGYTLVVPNSVGAEVVVGASYSWVDNMHFRQFDLSSFFNVPEQILANCRKVQVVTLNPMAETIGNRAFAGDVNLKAINLPETLSEIGAFTFYNTGLEEITIPKNVQYIGTNAFANCTQLKKVVIEDGVRLVIDKDAFLNIAPDATIEIKRENIVTQIDWSRYNLIEEKAEEIAPPENEITVEDNKTFNFGLYEKHTAKIVAEEEGKVVNTVTDKWTVDKIIEGMSNVEVAESTGSDTAEEEWIIKVFLYPEEDSSLKDEYLVIEKTNIGNMKIRIRRYNKENMLLEEKYYSEPTYRLGSFMGEAVMKPVSMSGSYNNINWNLDKDGVLALTGTGSTKRSVDDKVWVSSWVKEVVIGEGITEAHGFGGSHENLEKITLPTTLETIGTLAFYNTKLQKVVLPENVKSIGTMAFIDCENLKEVVVTSKVPVKIERSAFYVAEGARVYLPETVYQIDELAFSYTWGVMGGYGVGGIVESLTIIAPYGCPAYTWATKKGINVEIGAPQTEITIMVNGVKLNCDSTPYIKNDRTMVPMRAIFEALGAAVTWDDAMKTASGSKDRIEVKITIGENVLYKNGEAIELDCAAEITNSRTMVPVRAISEAFNATVHWDNETKTVEINLNQQ